ncbi:hypothetical protein GI582_15835 [Sulfitobacter sp. BDSS02]|nr:hypothetical protein [Sulfitobacter sp. BDSS02]MBR9849356.1 hypothetical protein [Paracoccaceae bacterium]
MIRRFLVIGCCLGLVACNDYDEATTFATPTEFEAMRQPCIDQAATLTSIPADQITVSSEIETGGGPLLTLDAAGTRYSCRKEADGSVTVFSEFAN